MFTSKIRYGLQLLGNVRWTEVDSTNQDLQAIQKCKNKLLRVLNGTKISDKVSINSMLLKLKIKSVNQINAQIKLSEMWKSVNIDNYPIKINLVSRSEEVAQTRAYTKGQLQEVLATNTSQRSFINDATHIWNKAPTKIKQCKTLASAKLAINAFVLTLPS